MVPESDNFVFGRTLSPWSDRRTPGGSSGGEGALLAAHCTPLGLGSDIGGSIRIPAAFCGVAGFKPTAQRLTRRGMPAPRPRGIDGQCAVLPTAGPLARRVGDLRLLLAALLRDGEGGQWGLGGDPTVPLLPWSYAAFEARRRGLPGRLWRAAASVPPPPTGGGDGGGGAPSPARLRPLRVGVLAGDGFWEPAAPCARAVREAAAALAAGGHDVVKWEPRAAGADTRRAAVVYYALLAADGGLAEFKAGLEGEALHPMYSLLNVLASLPRLLRAPLAALLRLLGQTRAAELLSTARGRSTREYWAMVAERDAFKEAFLDAWRAAGFDVLLCPAMGVPAFLHGQSRDLTPACSATFLWNLIDAPCGVLPVTRVRADECAYEAPPEQRDAFAAAAGRALAGAEGLPVGVQVVGLPWRDEETLEAMEELERLLAAAPDAEEQAWRAEGGVPAETLRDTLEKLGAGKALSYLAGWNL
jgi:fatty acid amide hydrolase